MNPQPFGWPSAYPPFVGLAIVTGVLVMVVQARHAGVPMTRLLVLHVVLSVAFLAGALAYNLIEMDALDRFDWRELFGSGLRYPGGVILGAAVLPLAHRLIRPKISILGYLDLVAPALAFAMTVVRIGCFLMGCCYGVRSDLPWAVSFAPTSQAARHHVANHWIPHGSWSLPVHPLQIYFGLASLAVGTFLVWYQGRKRYEGQVSLLYLSLHEGAKGLLEFLRGSTANHSVVHLRVVSLTISLLASGALLALAAGPRGDASPST